MHLTQDCLPVEGTEGKDGISNKRWLLDGMFLKEKEFDQEAASSQKLKQELAIASQEQNRAVGTPGICQADLERLPLFREILAQLEVLSLTLCTFYTCCFSIWK